MSSFNSLLIIKISFGVLVTCTVTFGQSLLLTGPPKVKIAPNSKSAEVTHLRQHSFLQADYVNVKRNHKPGYRPTAIRVNAVKLDLSRKKMNSPFKGRNLDTIKAFCFERAAENMKVWRINAGYFSEEDFR